MARSMRLCVHISPSRTDSGPDDLDLVGSKYNIAPYWLEEIVLLLQQAPRTLRFWLSYELPTAATTLLLKRSH
jgi:hypothetical protein